MNDEIPPQPAAPILPPLPPFPTAPTLPPLPTRTPTTAAPTPTSNAPADDEASPFVTPETQKPPTSTRHTEKPVKEEEPEAEDSFKNIANTIREALPFTADTYAFRPFLLLTTSMLGAATTWFIVAELSAITSVVPLVATLACVVGVVVMALTEKRQAPDTAKFVAGFAALTGAASGAFGRIIAGVLNQGIVMQLGLAVIVALVVLMVTYQFFNVDDYEQDIMIVLSIAAAVSLLFANVLLMLLGVFNTIGEQGFKFSGVFLSIPITVMAVYVLASDVEKLKDHDRSTDSWQTYFPFVVTVGVALTVVGLFYKLVKSGGLQKLIDSANPSDTP